MLKLVNIVKQYGSGENVVNALKGVDLEFRKSEFVSILGPSGCGKTTMLNIIGGLDRYTSGDLIIAGKSTKNYKDKEWDAYRSNSIGFVFQSYNLIPHESVLGNVELALTISGVNHEERKNRAIAVLKKVGLENQLHKLPNTLSGGQMQRVAIARALVNNPEIILADEPTGALDSENSVQIMELLKEVAKDRLVIMVTHNPELAKQYSTRIINLLDGEKIGDTNPYVSESKSEEKLRAKPKMGIVTAFKLSLRNLFTKKARTALTGFAGSIGIIGIALVLALSSGFTSYITKMQTDTMSNYPLSISESSVDLSTFNEVYESDMKEKFPSTDTAYVRQMFDQLTGMLKANNLSDEFLKYLSEADREKYYSLQYDYGYDMNNYICSNINIDMGDGEGAKDYFWSINTLIVQIEELFNSKLASTGMPVDASTIRQYVPTMREMPDSGDLLKSQYDCIYGNYPDFGTEKEASQAVIVVDEYNQISDITLALLGYLSASFDASGSSANVSFGKTESFTFEDMIGHKFYVADNNDKFIKFNNQFAAKAALEKKDCEELEIVGILRLNKATKVGVLDTGIAYTTALTKKVLAENKNSDIVTAAKASKEGVVNVVVGKQEDGSFKTVGYPTRTLAGNDRPAVINIFAKDYQSKEDLKVYIEAWNKVEGRLKADMISYSDMMSMVFSTMNTIVDAVSYVLIAFTAISLIVSSIMIGIITYVSVVERTKEIGVLRSLGASKMDISNVFNAETFLIGMFSGLLGVGVAYLLSIPINLILSSLVAGVGALVMLNPLHALVLVVISVCLTLVAGLFPSMIAAKKDPVVALRTE